MAKCKALTGSAVKGLKLKISKVQTSVDKHTLTGGLKGNLLECVFTKLQNVSD